MRVEQDGRMLVLSRRNVESLLAKLNGDPPDSKCEIHAPAIYGYFAVRAEENEVHYANESRGDAVSLAGPMHPATEARLTPSAVEVG